jgi:hypothetical protein
MGVSVRVSKNTRVSMPFWFAIPVYMIVAAIWMVILITMGVVWLVGLPFRLRKREV